MGAATIEAVTKVLLKIPYPGFSRDIVSFGVVENIEIDDFVIKVMFKFTTQNDQIIKEIKEKSALHIKSEFPEYNIQIMEKDLQISSDKVTNSPGGDPWAGRANIPGIKNIIAVASGKGGVGKSTVSTNLALALAENELKIGLMDSDIYGPSIHIMMGIDSRPMVNPDQKIIPMEKFGIKMMSMGFLIDRDAPLIWRGPLVMKAVEQFLNDVIWGELDVLVIDLPPGTGDAQLTLVQKTPLTGAIIVTTPQEVSLIDARRGLKMFQKVNTPVIGIVENMSYYICSDCGHKATIFGSNGGKKTAEEMDVPLLGQIPVESAVRESGDRGEPIVSAKPESASSQVYKEIALKILEQNILSF